MGLMLSVLVMCVGVLEAISAVQHIRESYLPLEFKRKKRRMVMDMGTGTVRHVDISWPGDVPRGSHVIRRRSGMQSPHSSLDVPDEDLPRRTSVHFDPLQLERAMSEILLEEEPSDETSEETSISSPIAQARLEFSTPHTAESAAVPNNELRLETEQLPGNRPSLVSLEADIVDPKTPEPRTNRPPSVRIAENDSVSPSPKENSRDRLVTSTKEFIPENQLSVLRDSAATSSPLSTNIPESPQPRDCNESGSPLTDRAPVITTDETHQPSSTVETREANQEDITQVQGSPLISPIVSEIEGSITSVTEISGSISTSSLLLDESTDKSEEAIPKDESNRSLDRLESIEELIKSTNNIIIHQDSGIQAIVNGGVIHSREFVENDSIGSKTDTKSLLDESKDFTVDTKSEPSSTPSILSEAEIAPVLNELDDSETSVSSVVQTTEENVSSNERKSSDDPTDFHYKISPEAASKMLPFQHDEGKLILQGLPTHERDIFQLTPARQVASSTNLVAELELPCHIREDSHLERGLSHESTISLESVEESSNTSLESQGLPSLPSLKDQKLENYLIVDALSDIERDGSLASHVGHKVVEEPVTAFLQCHSFADSQAKVSNQTYSENENDGQISGTVRFSGESASGEPLECSTRQVASPGGEDDLGIKQASLLTEHVFSRSESQKGNQRNKYSNLDGSCGAKDVRALPKTDKIQDSSKDDVEQLTPIAKPHRNENFEDDSSGQSVGIEVSGVVKSSIAEGAPLVDVTVIGDVHETKLVDTRVLETEKNHMVRRKSLIETESITTHQIENDEHVSAQRSNQSNETESAAMVNCEDACSLQDSVISSVSDHISQSAVNDEAPASGVDFEDVTINAKIESHYDGSDKREAESSSRLCEHESNSESDVVLGTQKNDIIKRKSLLETENTVISTHQIENDEHVSHQQANQANETQSATMVDCEHTSTLQVQDNVTCTVSSPISSEAAGDNEEEAPVGADRGDVTVDTETEDSSRTNCKSAVDQSSRLGELAPTPESQKEISNSSRKSNKKNSKACKEDVLAAQTDQDRAIANDLLKRDVGQNESNSNEIPTANTDRSNVSEVKQDTRSVFAVEEGEVIKVAASAPAEPKMEDIKVPTADTSPNKAFWVRD